jgi:hypothetical protein
LELDAYRYDVDSGLRLDRRKPLAIIGPERVRRYLAEADVDDPTQIPGAVIYSSSGPTGSGYLVDTTLPMGVSVNGNGFVFRNLMFDTDNAAGAILDDNVNQGVVENCFFALGQPDAWAIKMVTKDSFVEPDVVHGDDASWWRIENNSSRGGGFFLRLEPKAERPRPTTGTTISTATSYSRRSCQLDGDLLPWRTMSSRTATARISRQTTLRENGIPRSFLSPRGSPASTVTAARRGAALA